MNKEKFYITCAIPYVNGSPHLGHALEFTQTDVLARYQRLQGKDVLLQHGADQHGSKNYKKAQELGKDPLVFVNEITEQFKQIHKALNISYDRFIGTTEDRHKKASQAIWKRLDAAKAVYKAQYEGLYCVGCESFVTEEQSKLNGGVCPNHKQPYEQLSEENYFFKLSSYTDAIKEAITTNQFVVTPNSRRNEILQVLEDGLEDISISRPKQKLPWGVPVPGDADHVMYVWFDALINYISVLDYPDGEDFKKYWPADIQVIGKDILRHHAAIWPAMLLGAGLPLAHTLHAHGFITSEGQKMSKTVGNVVDPFEAINGYGADPFRYYLIRHIPTGGDGDFSWEKFENAYNTELANDLGNLVQRVASMIQRYQQGAIGSIPPPEHDSGAYHEAMANLQFDRALDFVFEMIQGLNQFIEQEKPWDIAKEEDTTHLQEVLAYLASSLLQVATLLEPFMPDTASKITQAFGNEIVDPGASVMFPKIHNYTS
jgi:methionyl-tRNA synthetase